MASQTVHKKFWSREKIQTLGLLCYKVQVPLYAMTMFYGLMLRARHKKKKRPLFVQRQMSQLRLCVTAERNVSKMGRKVKYDFFWRGGWFLHCYMCNVKNFDVESDFLNIIFKWSTHLSKNERS